MKQLLSKKTGLVFIIIQFLITIGLIVFTMYVDVLPDRYLLILVLVCVFLLLYTFFSQMSKRLYVMGRVLSGIFCAAMIAGMGYLWMGYSTLDNIADNKVKIDKVSAIVLASDSAQTVDDAAGYTFGIVTSIGRDVTNQMIETLNTDLGKEIAIKEYADVNSMVDGLYAREVGAMLFNEAFRENIKENYKNFDTDTKILQDHEIETVVNIDEPEDDENDEKDNVLKKPFIMYLSGIDTKGKISLTSRSDVNIIAVVNPESKQILLLNTPRDYFVPLSISNGVRDKLTHAGIYGIDVSIETLEMLYDIDVDYYVRVNFSGFEDIVDALGGVKVYSDYTFTSDWGPSFKKGYNNVNGKQALAFCRERHHLPSGDNQRGRNHQHMIAAILDKATSPKILTKFSSLMKSLEDSFETNMKTKRITKYVKMQMDESPQWNIESIAVTGGGGKEYTYSISSRKLYVTYPDVDSIETAKKAIQTILDGKKLKKKKADSKNN